MVKKEKRKLKQEETFPNQSPCGHSRCAAAMILCSA